MQPLAIFRALARCSMQRTRLRPVGNILVKARLRLLLRYQELLILARQIEGNAREKQDPPRFEMAAVFARSALGIAIGSPAAGKRIILDFRPSRRSCGDRCLPHDCSLTTDYC